MSTYAADNFDSIADGGNLDGRTASDGGTWTEHANVNTGAQAGQTSRVRNNNGGSGNRSLAYHSADAGGSTPADYDVQADIVVHDITNESFMGVAGRIATGAATYYWTRYRATNTTIQLFVVSAGAQTMLGNTSTNVPTVSFTLKLEMRGTTIKAFAGATEILSATDSAISAAGKSGVVSEGFAVGATNGQHIDNFQGIDLATGGVVGDSTKALPLSGSATGTLALSGTSSKALPLGGVATGVLAIAGDSSKALPLAGTATGTLALTGASTAALPLSGSAAGTLLIQGESSQPLPLGGTATGSSVASGDSTQALPLSGSATGTLLIQGASTATLPLAGTGTGTLAISGDSSQRLPLGSIATGALQITGDSSRPLPLGGSASGIAGQLPEFLMLELSITQPLRLNLVVAQPLSLALAVTPLEV